MNNIKNFRELAFQVCNKQGKHIQKNMIFRSGALDNIDTYDLDVFNQLGIFHIYDLRSSSERLKDNSSHRIKTIHFDVVNSKSNTEMNQAFLEMVAPKAQAFMLMLYQEHLPFSTTLKPLMQAIINEKNPFLFHCAAGKDRTGIVGALIMAILDFDRASIINEYNHLDPKVIIEAEEGLRKQGLSEEVIKQLRPLNGVHLDFIEGFLDIINEKYGSMSNYINAFLCLDAAQINLFREIYLTD